LRSPRDSENVIERERERGREKAYFERVRESKREHPKSNEE